ncbi:hypothetical protein DSO57_1028786 [Entomophthora muscae]|uniref:Uncharacterized protein n=1 Tax=Entomophthora muscae TaxID=34485 RepID=A0ACC2UAS9_9FUNG|nr:hypothetical protein DSO57_1028786 [Entomophthora muscae]
MIDLDALVLILFSARIDNFLPLETQVQEPVLNPGPDYLKAARPKNQETNQPHFFGTESPQAEDANTSKDEDTSRNLETTAPNGRQNKFLTGGKSTQLTNQDSPPEKNTDLKAAPMTTAQEQKG